MILRIDAVEDPRVADYRDLRDPELVRRRGLFVAEGRLVVERLVDQRRYTIRSLLLSEAAERMLAPSLSTLDAGVPVYVCGARDFPGITGYNIHRGCLALVERPAAAPRVEVVAGRRLVVVLEAVANADNVGGVFRNVAAFRAGGVLLDPATCDPLYRKAIRTSMAATLRVPFARLGEAGSGWPAALDQLRARGFTLVALTPRTPSVDLEAFAATVAADRIALLVGNEGVGLTTDAEAAADHRVRIPIAPEIDSLNVSVAVGIALYALARWR